MSVCVCVYFCIALSQMLMLCVASKLCYVNVCLRDFSDVNAMHCVIFLIVY